MVVTSSMLTRCQRDGFQSASGAEGSMAGKVTRSLEWAVRRLRLNPISARPFRALNRSVVNGIRYSACQPSDSRRTARSQTPFHAGLSDASSRESLLMAQSFRCPPGVVLKLTAFCRSPKVSSVTLMKSPGESSSRIIELARTPPSCPSQASTIT